MIKPNLKKLLWIEELLPFEIVLFNRHGGKGYYLDGKLVLILVESGTTYDYKGITYPFKIWNGCFFPIDKIKQNAVFAKFQFLENHPALKDSLYLPADSENFAEEVQLIMREIKKRNLLFGIRIKKRTLPQEIIVSDSNDLDTSRPKTFSDVPKVQIIAKEKDFNFTKKKELKVKVSRKNDNKFLLSVLKKRS